MENRKLKGKLLELGVTYAEVAKTLGISETSFVNKINGKVHFSLPEVIGMSNFLKLTDADKINIFLH